MIRRVQAEALLQVAEALEACERVGVTVGIVDIELRNLGLSRPMNFPIADGAPALRMAIAQLYPKTERPE